MKLGMDGRGIGPLKAFCGGALFGILVTIDPTWGGLAGAAAGAAFFLVVVP